MRCKSLIVLAALCTLCACRHTAPGTHVEVIDKGGNPVYVAGAAAPGLSKSIACRGAVARAAAAIALRFAQEHDDIGDDVADEVGATDGEVFLQKYAKDTVMDSGVHDLRFDPSEHICMANVNWQPPVFIKEAILTYAEKMKADELGSVAGSEPAPAPSPSGTPAPTRRPAPATPPPPPVSVAPAPAPSGPNVPACTSQRSKLEKVLRSSQKALDKLAECKRKTGGDETICHGYVLKAEAAKKKEDGAGRELTACLNASLSTDIRRAIDDALPGHAAVAVETSASGNPILWAFSPVDQTAFAIEVRGGQVTSKSPLPANQVQWVRQQLGL